MNIKLDKIYVSDDFNVRIRHDEASVNELMESIKNVGLLQSVLVNDNISNDLKKKGYEYKLLVGFRRFFAIKNLFHDSIDARIVHIDTLKDEILINLIENIQRSNITKEQEGLDFLKMKKDFGMEYSEIAVCIGKNLNYVRNAVSIAQCIPSEYRKNVVSDIAKNMVTKKNGRISATCAGLIASASKGGIGGRVNMIERDKLLDYAKKDGISKEHIQSMLSLMRQGYNIDDAFLVVKHGKMMSFKILFFDNQFEKDAKKMKICMIELLYRILEDKGYKIVRKKIKKE